MNSRRQAKRAKQPLIFPTRKRLLNQSHLQTIWSKAHGNTEQTPSLSLPTPKKNLSPDPHPLFPSGPLFLLQSSGSGPLPLPPLLTLKKPPAMMRPEAARSRNSAGQRTYSPRIHDTWHPTAIVLGRAQQGSAPLSPPSC